MRRGRDPAFTGAQVNLAFRVRSSALRRPEVAARTRFAERESAQMISRSRRPPNVDGGMRLQHRDPAIVHAQHHGGGPALFGDAPHDFRRAAEPQAKAAHFGRTHGSQDASGFQGAYGLIRERAIPVDRGRIRGDGLTADPLERFFICLRNCAHYSSHCQHLGQRGERQPRLVANFLLDNVERGHHSEMVFHKHS